MGSPSSPLLPTHNAAQMTARLPEVAFEGRLIAYDDRNDVTVYLTRRRRIGVHDARQALHQFDTFDDFAENFNGLPGLVADSANALGEHHVIELDI